MLLNEANKDIKDISITFVSVMFSFSILALIQAGESTRCENFTFIKVWFLD